MKKARVILLLLSVLFCCNCTNNKNIQSDKENLVVKMNFNDLVSIHDIGLIDSIDILRLDNNTILGRINKVIKHDNYIFLLDAFMTNSVSVYDTFGNLIKEIANVGQGSEEYLQPTDIFIDEKENVLALVSRTDRKLLKYNLENLDLKSVEKLPKAFFSLIDVENGYIGYMNNLIDDKPFNLWTMSNILELKDHLFEFPSSWNSKSSGTIRPFSKFGDKVYYIQPYDFNVYNIGEDGCKISYKYDLGSNTWPSNIKEYEDVERIKEESSGKYVEDFYMFQETDCHLIVRTVFKGKELLGIYDKKTGKSNVAKLDAYFDKYLISFGKIVGMDENAIYSLVDAVHVKRAIVGKDEYNDFESIYPTQVKNIREKFRDISISEEDNPFLVIHYFNLE